MFKPEENFQAYGEFPDIREYVDKYAKIHGITPMEACKHVIVGEYIKDNLNGEI